MSGVKRFALILLGHACVAAGVAGIFLPLVPTTPFLLLAAACYIRSSERHYRWIVSHRVFGPIIRDFQERRGIRPRVKVIALVLVWSSLSISIFRTKSTTLDAVLVACGMIATFCILRLQTLSDTADQPDSLPGQDRSASPDAEG